MNPTWLYVAVLYAVAVWLGRRARVDLPWRFAGLFYVLVLLFMFQAMTGPYVNFPVDYLQMLPPWSLLTHGRHLGNFELNDLATQIVPWAHQVRESWRSLHVPLWNARAGTGYPLLANGQSSALSPLRLLALPLSLGHSMTAEAAMKLLIAATFMFLYCRRRGHGEIGSTIAAVGFAFGTTMTVWLHFPLATAACFLPATFYALELLVERLTHGRFVFAACVWTMILLSGHPETAAHLFLLGLMALVWIVGVERPFAWREAVRFVLVAGGALIVAALLAAPFLAPFIEGLNKSKRFDEVKSQHASVSTFDDFDSAVILFQPHFFGELPDDTNWGPEHPESITAFTGILGFVGFLALLLRAFITRRFRTREFFLVVATFLVIAVLLNWPVVGALFHKVFFLAANARLRLLLGFLLALQAAAAVDLLLPPKGEPAPFATNRLPLLIGIAIPAATLLWLMTPSRFGIPWQRVGSALAIMPSVFVLAVATLAVVAGRWRRIALMLLLVVVIAEVWHSGIRWNAIVPDRDVYPMTPLLKKLEAIRSATPPNDPFRVIGIGAMFFPNANAVYGYDDPRIHDPMANAIYVHVLRTAANYETAYFAKWLDIDSLTLNYLNVRYVLVEPWVKVEDRSRYVPLYEGKDGSIFENRDAMPRFFPSPVVILEFKRDRLLQKLAEQQDWRTVAFVQHPPELSEREKTDLLAPRPPGSKETAVRIVAASDTGYRLRVDAPRYSLVTSSIAWWPGWRVTANGHALEPIRVNDAFLGFIVPPGVSDVRVEYAPVSFLLGAIVALLTLAVLAALSRRSLRLRLSGSTRSE